VKDYRILKVLTVGILLAYFGLIHAQAPPAISGVPVISVCEVLDNLSKYNGKPVIIIAKISSTGEGIWLTWDCQTKLVTQGVTWPNTIWYALTPRGRPSDPRQPPYLPDGFSEGENLMKTKLRELLKTAKPEQEAKFVAAFGRFETRQPLPIGRDGKGNLRAAGYGHLNSSPGQLVSSFGMTDLQQ